MRMCIIVLVRGPLRMLIPSFTVKGVSTCIPGAVMYVC